MLKGIRPYAGPFIQKLRPDRHREALVESST